MPLFAPSVDDAIAAIPDGAMVVVPREASGVPMEATRALIRRGIKRLHLVALPTSTMQADMLIGAGCVETLETSAVSLGEFGPAPRFTAAILGKTIRMKDATCPALYASVQAAEKGVPFMPLRGLIGSDILAHRPDWRVIDNPFGNNDPIVLLPAIKPDFALFHAGMADRAGNVFVGRDRELLTMAHASARTIATVEKLYDGNLMDDPALSAGTVPGFYVDTIALAPRGAWPLPLLDHYPADGAHLAEYAKLAATAEGFARYLKHVCEEGGVTRHWRYPGRNGPAVDGSRPRAAPDTNLCSVPLVLRIFSSVITAGGEERSFDFRRRNPSFADAARSMTDSFLACLCSGVGDRSATTLSRSVTSTVCAGRETDVSLSLFLGTLGLRLHAVK